MRRPWLRTRGPCRAVALLLPSAVLALACLVATGCGGAPNRSDVSGEVTFDGKPIPAGRIYFNPDTTKGNDGPQGFADIRDGKFDTSQGGKGAVGGPTIAVIQGYDGNQRAKPGSPGNPLFREYKVAIDLPRETSTQAFHVPAAAAKDLPKMPRGDRGP